MVIKGPGFANGIIILEEPEAVYYSGQLLSGNLHFELNEPLSYTAINLVYLGEASVKRTEVQYVTSWGGNVYRQVEYEGQEQYFNMMICVSGGVGVSLLPAGLHSIPFQFQVPFNTPSSFKGENGNILYTITAYLEYPEAGRREQLVKEFSVVAPISPTTMSNKMQPLVLDFEEIETCNCFCTSKPIDVKVALPSATFQMGTVIPINVKVENDSSVEIYDICFTITKRHTYRTQQPRSEYSAPEETLVEMKKGPVLSQTRREYTWPLPLPAAVLPNLEACAIMDVTYLFKVKIQMTGCTEAVEDELEIFIGVLPDSDTFAMTSPDVVAHLPKAPVPNPSMLPVGLVTPAQNYLDNSQVRKQSGSEIVPTQTGSAQKNPYEIGFRTSTIPSQPPYSESSINSGYPAYPTGPPTNPSYPYGQSPYNSSQSNIAIVPSAPPLCEN